jgi:ferredoxin
MTACGIILLFLSSNTSGQDRFPRPEFQNGYTQPTTIFPAARSPLYSILDTVKLVLALSLAAWLAIRKRSRKGLFLLSLGCLLYFGFYRKGCICPVGSVQNVAQGMFDSSFALPLTVGLFFGLPLLFALLFGRIFCSSVCPLGAIQDIVLLKPVKVPPLLSSILGLLPHLYLGAAILFVATGAGYVICRFDPFVGFFRRSGSAGMIFWGLSILLIGVFVARPYCRYLCPYGILLGWASLLSWRPVTITPDTCINCRLCEDTCPFDAIRIPTTAPTGESRPQSVRRLLLHGALLPVWIIAGALSGSQASGVLSLAHHQVRLAEQLLLEEKGAVNNQTMESRTFRAGPMPVPDLITQAQEIRRTMKFGGTLLGIYLGMVIGLSMVRLSLQRKQTGYTPDRQKCLSCGRCFQSCPQEHQRLKKLKTPIPLLSGTRFTKKNVKINNKPGATEP